MSTPLEPYNPFLVVTTSNLVPKTGFRLWRRYNPFETLERKIDGENWRLWHRPPLAGDDKFVSKSKGTVLLLCYDMIYPPFFTDRLEPVPRLTPYLSDETTAVRSFSWRSVDNHSIADSHRYINKNGTKLKAGVRPTLFLCVFTMDGTNPKPYP